MCEHVGFLLRQSHITLLIKPLYLIFQCASHTETIIDGAIQIHSYGFKATTAIPYSKKFGGKENYVANLTNYSNLPTKLSQFP